MFFSYMWQKIKFFFVKNKKIMYELSTYLVVIAACIFSRTIDDPNGIYFVPLVCCVVLFIIHSVAKYVKAVSIDKDIPVAYKRFTSDDGCGIISIDRDDLNSAINYLYDVENYIESNKIKE